MFTIDFDTHARQELRELTDAVQSRVAQSGIQRGLVVIQSPHTTLGLTVNENADPDVVHDMLGHLTTLVPRDPRFRHQEDNADSHIKVSLVGPSVTLIVEDGRVQLGRWQGIFACEFDGPRPRHVWLTVLGT